MLKNRSTSSRGYSLIEMLVVVAIVGIMSLVSVPMFMSFVRTAKMKSAMRSFTSDVRSTRQRAITQNHPTMISFQAAVDQRVYYDFDGTVGAGGVVTYTLANRNPQKLLNDISYFGVSGDPCVFDDVVTAPVETNGFNDIVFLPNGTIQNIPVPPGSACTAGRGRIFLATAYKLTKNGRQMAAGNYFTIEMSSSGQLSVQ